MLFFVCIFPKYRRMVYPKPMTKKYDTFIGAKIYFMLRGTLIPLVGHHSFYMYSILYSFSEKVEIPRNYPPPNRRWRIQVGGKRGRGVILKPKMKYFCYFL